MKSRSIFSAIITVAALSASADVLNVEVLDLDAPREEPPTVVPTRPPDDPEPVNEPCERPTLPGSEEVTNRVAEALLFRAWGAVVDYFDSADENGVEYTTQLVIPTWTWEGFLGEDETNGVTRAAKKASFDWYLGHLATNCCANFSDDQTNYVRIALNECRDLKYTNAWQSLKGIALNSSAPYRGYRHHLRRRLRDLGCEGLLPVALRGFRHIQRRRQRGQGAVRILRRRGQRDAHQDAAGLAIHRIDLAARLAVRERRPQRVLRYRDRC